MSNNLAYANYWQRKQLLARPLPAFVVKRWWPEENLSEIEQIYFDAVKDATSLLDVGAGDLRIKRKFERAGYRGRYDTQDIGGEYEYTFSRLEDAAVDYGAILCLDVIEHLPLEAGLLLLMQIIGRLAPGGVLILQTPNARCIRHPLSWDMTHVQCYNVYDLWAYLTTLGLETTGYRVCFSAPHQGLFNRMRTLLQRYVVTRLMHCDYADNISLVARKLPAP